MPGILIKNTQIVNEGVISNGDILIRNGRIEKIDTQIDDLSVTEINGEGKHVFPGVIDDQVHFREPGLTHKATIYTESRAAVAGGVTSFMEMPNTVPQSTSQELLEEKYAIGARDSLANYSFFFGATNDNIDELLKTDPKNICGIKVFMGSSTGNMLVDNEKTLSKIFKNAPTIVATHCEDEATIRKNTTEFRKKYGDDIPFNAHPLIRSEEACYLSSSYAVSLARKHGARLHVLHISTAKELELFSNNIPLKEKMITSEACIHHMWFDDKDYESKGARIKWNPAVKSEQDRKAIFQAVLDNKIDVVATDHAPHTDEEKNNEYLSAPSGGPLVQHSLVAMLEFYHQGKISLERIAEKMSHAPADLFRIKDRGYIREGYFADLVLVDLSDSWTVNKNNLLYKCQWSPFEGTVFQSKVLKTIVSGNLVYDNGTIVESKPGMRMSFER